MRRIAMIAIFGALGLAPAGCMLHRVDYSAKSAIVVDPKSAFNEYWFDKPATQSVHASDYDLLWNAADHAMRSHSFLVDRTDYRDGWLTTQPLVSKQPFEFWMRDVVDARDEVECTLSTMRRTVRFHIRKLEDGTYVCEPKVVVERYQMPERRITAVEQYQEAFTTFHQPEAQSTDEGAPLRIEYWYATGRDPALERSLADSMRSYIAEARKRRARERAT